MTSPPRAPVARPAPGDLLVGEPPDVRLLLPAATAWLVAMAALGWSPSSGLRVALCFLGVAVFFALGFRRGWALVLAAAALCAAGASAATAWRIAALERGPLPGLARAGASVELELVVGGDPKVLTVGVGTHGATRSIVVFSATAVRVMTDDGAASSIRSPVFVLAAGRGWAALQPSEHVRGVGRLGVPDPGEMEAATFDARGSPSAIGKPSLVERVAGRVRAGLRAAAAPLPDAPGGLLPGLVDGDVSRLPPAVEADFKTTGLTHLVAVSGANVAIVIGVVLALARRIRLRPRGQACLASLAIVAFVIVARPQPSVLRAAAMGLVAVLALATGRRRRALPALCAAVLCLVYVEPPLARSVGFALSVLATGALLVLAPPLRERMARRLPGWLADALAAPTAATLVCAPLIASISGAVSLVAVPANLLAEPAVAPATILGVVAACVAPWWVGGARVVAFLGGLPCAWLVLVARSFARLPGAALRWPSGLAGALDLLVVVALAALAFRLRGRARAARDASNAS